MKLILHTLFALSLAGTFASGACAANLEGYLPYRIVSYTFSSDVSEAGTSNLGPLLITGTTSDILTDIPHTSGVSGTTDIFAVSADFLATSDFSLRGAFGVTKNRFDASFDPDYTGSWEANLGVIYKLFNNIRYEIHFGYMETGDLFKERNTYKNEESIIMISNKLTMSF